MTDRLRAEAVKVLEGMLEVSKDKNGLFKYEIYADYRDEMQAETAIEILRAEDPEQALWEKVDEWYADYEMELRADLEEKVEEKLTDEDGPYPDGLIHLRAITSPRSSRSISWLTPAMETTILR